MTRRIFHCLCTLAAVSALLLPSCAKVEMIDGGAPIDPDQIAFGVTTGVTPMPEMRGGSQEEETPAMLLSPGGEDTLYLHPSVVVNDRGFGMPATRGVPVTKDNISSFTVTAKVHGSETPYMNEVKVTRQGDSNVWTTSDGKHFWPDEQTSLDFYAYSYLTETDNPANPDSPDVSSLTCERVRLGFSYIVPNGTGGSDAERQPDILFALASANRSQTQDGDGTVILNFEHALAGVQFRAKNIAGGTIKRITLKNLYAKGDCTYSLSDSPVVEGSVIKNGTFEWTTTGNKVKFSQNMNVGVSESSTLPDGTLQDVTTGDNAGMTFMMIPQKLENVEVEIELVGALDDRQYTVSGRLSTATGSWEAGNIYIYDISTDSINWTYVFEVTPSITFNLGQTSAPYTVTSYRFRTQLGDSEANREPVPWTASNTSFSEMNIMAKEDEKDVSYDKIVKSFIYSGGAGSDAIANTYQIELHGTKMHTTHDNDEHTLRSNPSRGSAEEYYDLSTHDLNGNKINETTANCYVVNAAGYYKLPLVYGNARKNGTDNTSAYDNSAFTDYKGNQIKGPYITGADDATLVWSDGFFMFKDIKLSEDKKYLTFRIDPDYLQQANAVLAVRDADDNIMWSWHIWVTERDIYSTHTITDYFNQNNTFELMSCNLGWVDGKMVYYNQRDLAYQFTQAGSGKTAPMTVLQEGETFDYKDVGSTYYQWGRKDPLVAMRNWDQVGRDDYRLHETGRSDYGYATAEKRVSIAESIQHPNLYYVRGSTSEAANWCSSDIPSLWNTYGQNVNGTTQEPKDVISSTKTIYDPSPRGFKVPVPRAFAVFVNGSHGDGGQGGVGAFNGVLNGEQVLNGNELNQYKVWTKPNGQGSQIPFTATGQRADKAGLPVYMEGDNAGELGGLWSMYGVYYWTCVALDNITGYSFVVRHDQPDTNPKAVRANSYRFNGTKTMARPVRPIKE